MYNWYFLLFYSHYLLSNIDIVCCSSKFLFQFSTYKYQYESMLITFGRVMCNTSKKIGIWFQRDSLLKWHFTRMEQTYHVLSWNFSFSFQCLVCSLSNLETFQPSAFDIQWPVPQMDLEVTCIWILIDHKTCNSLHSKRLYSNSRWILFN